MAGYIGNQAQIRSGLSATIDELNIIDGVTATTAELNILDGVTSTATELNILDGVTATTAELNIMDGVTATTAELNIMDGVTATAAEINLIDGGTARGTTAVADGDGFLTNDGGTMRMTKVDTLATYMGTKITGGAMVFIASSGAISGAASVQFRAQDGHFDATKFDHYVFYFQHVVPVNDGAVGLAQTSTNDGSAYASSSGDYHSQNQVDESGLVVTKANAVGSATNEFGISGPFNLYSPHTTAYTYSFSNVIFMDTGGGIRHAAHDDPSKASSVRLAAEDVDAVKFLFSSGNIESGEIVMYGIANGS